MNWNTRDLLATCLASIYRYPPGCPFEVIVVDNASTDGSTEMLRQQFPQVLAVSPGNNTGYAAGNNLAFSKATGHLLLTLNPDTEVYEDTFAEAIKAVERHPKAGAIGARQVGLDGKTQRSIRGFPTFVNIFGDLTKLSVVAPTTELGSYRLRDFDYEIEQVAPQPMGTFLLFTRSALEKVGDPKKPFDENFPIFFNEVDLLFRLKQAGFDTWYCPQVHIKHHGGESTKLVRKNMIWESHRSLARFFHKHYQTLWNRPALALLDLMIYAGAFVRAKGYHAGFRA